MINLEKKHLDFVKATLKQYIPDHTVWLFGSRTTEKIKPYSDIDLCIITEKPLDIAIMVELSLAFEESDLPYKIDILDWSLIKENFKKIILEKYEIIQHGAHHEK